MNKKRGSQDLEIMLEENLEKIESKENNHEEKKWAIMKINQIMSFCSDQNYSIQAIVQAYYDKAWEIIEKRKLKLYRDSSL